MSIKCKKKSRQKKTLRRRIFGDKKGGQGSNLIAASFYQQKQRVLDLDPPATLGDLSRPLVTSGDLILPAVADMHFI